MGQILGQRRSQGPLLLAVYCFDGAGLGPKPND